MSCALTARIPAIVTAFAVVLMGLLPDAHLHTGGDRTRVHRHVISDTATHHHDSAVGHDAGHDHADARTLTASFDVGRQMARLGSLVVAPWFLAGPGSDQVKPTNGKTRLPTHDPPLRFTSSPAPPAVV